MTPDNHTAEPELKDRTIRMVLIPFFGLTIPNVTGMIDNSRYDVSELVLHYAAFTIVAFAIWQGNRFLLFRIRPRFSWLRQPVHKIVALIISNVFYTIPVGVGLMTLWYAFAGLPADWNAIFKATALCVVCVVFITHTYETVFLIQSWESDKTRGEQLERAKAEAELAALRSQVDPHFMFNSLNTLSHLIEENPGRAKEFNENLADMYRYILAHRSHNLVPLSDELTFVNDFISMLRVRFGNAVMVTADIPEADTREMLLPPGALQTLVENAVKHNEFSESRPLNVHIRSAGDGLVITNELRPKRDARPSSRVGLKNLNDRCVLLSGRSVVHGPVGSQYKVQLPILRSIA